MALFASYTSTSWGAKDIILDASCGDGRMNVGFRNWHYSLVFKYRLLNDNDHRLNTGGITLFAG